MRAPTNASPYMTVDEVATHIRQGPKTVHRLCRDGALRATKLGKSWIIHVDDLAAFLGRAPQQPTQPARLRAVE